MKKLLIALTLGAAMAASAQNAITLSNATLKQDPQTRVVEVTYELTGNAPVFITLGIETNGVAITDPVTVTGDITTLGNLKAIAPDSTAPKKIRWNAKQDWPGNLTEDARAVITAWYTDDPPKDLASYVVIDLSEGPTANWYPVRYAIAPPNLGNDSCRTNELWLRRIPAGAFLMGAPTTEPGWRNTEDLHQVTLTQDFFIGVFQVTQKQWDLVMGPNNPTQQYLGDKRPVEKVSYNMIRGAGLGSQWPTNGDVDPTSFMGLLREKTKLNFDLPTEAQWEYACRAGTITGLNNGTEIAGTHAKCPNLDELGRYDQNMSDNKGGYAYAEHTVVGLYTPNTWGLYDMHGNVWELCLDWYADNLGTSALVNPKGPAPTGSRVRRGGAYNGRAQLCRSAVRSMTGPSDTTDYVAGLRVCIQPQ